MLIKQKTWIIPLVILAILTFQIVDAYAQPNPAVVNLYSWAGARIASQVGGQTGLNSFVKESLVSIILPQGLKVGMAGVTGHVFKTPLGIALPAAPVSEEISNLFGKLGLAVPTFSESLDLEGIAREMRGELIKMLESLVATGADIYQLTLAYITYIDVVFASQTWIYEVGDALQMGSISAMRNFEAALSFLDLLSRIAPKEAYSGEPGIGTVSDPGDLLSHIQRKLYSITARSGSSAMGLSKIEKLIGNIQKEIQKDLYDYVKFFYLVMDGDDRKAYSEIIGNVMGRSFDIQVAIAQMDDANRRKYQNGFATDPIGTFEGLLPSGTVRLQVSSHDKIMQKGDRPFAVQNAPAGKRKIRLSGDSGGDIDGVAPRYGLQTGPHVEMNGTTSAGPGFGVRLGGDEEGEEEYPF